MHKILIMGGGGMIGQKLARSLAEHGLGDDPAPQVTLFDIAFPPSGAPAARTVTGSVTDADTVARLLEDKPDTIIHLAAIVSGEAEDNFAKGWQINLVSFWSFLESLRALHEGSGGTYCPRVIFTSSVAVFGGPYPDKIHDEFLSAPQTSYGAQKSASEMMLGDMSRKGMIDGIALRLPTICVRPGKPNKAASGFFSGIIREPLNGVEAILPVADTVRHWHASPRSAVQFLRHAATLDTDLLNRRRALNLPGLSCTVAEQIEALRDVAGADVVARIKPVPDEKIMKIVAGWPRDFAPDRARALGFVSETSFHDIIKVYIEDEQPSG